MARWMRVLAAAVVTAVVAVACGSSSDTEVGTATTTVPATVEYSPYTQLELERPGGSPVTAADPDVVRIGDTWYLYPTTHAGGFEAWTSTDLQTWEYGGEVWEPTPGAWNDNGDHWAPDVHVDGSDHWLYYTAGERIGVARSDSPLGPFEDVLDHPLIGDGHSGVGDGVLDPGEGLLVNNEEKAIDPHLFEASDGSLTLYFTMYTPLSSIAAVPMEDPSTPAATEPDVLLEHAEEPWELFLREAPFVLENDGVFHLMFSAAGADTTCYAVGVATATDPLGPFTRRADNPILHDDPEAGFYGPGHHSVVEGVNGDLLAFFHTKDDEAISFDRSLRYAPITFDDDGAIAFDPPPPGDSAPGHSTCAERSG